MRIRFSPMVSQASGSAGPIVASRWKGINYFRERVTPANPKSDEQQAQRLVLRTVVAWYHDLEEQLVDDIKTLCVGMPYSAFNAFSSRNIRDLASYLVTKKNPTPTGVPPRIMPLNAPTNPITTLGGVAGAATKEINLTWSQAEAITGNKVYILAGETTADDIPPANLFVQEKDTTAVEAEALTVTMPKANQKYMIAVLVEDPATHKFSIADTIWALSFT